MFEAILRHPAGARRQFAEETPGSLFMIPGSRYDAYRWSLTSDWGGSPSGFIAYSGFNRSSEHWRALSLAIRRAEEKGHS